MAEPKSVILCGKSHEVGDVVIELLKPEYKGSSILITESSNQAVIRFITSTEQGVAEIPHLKDVYAIITGGGYDDEAFAKLKEAGGESVAWLRPDKTKPEPKDLGPDYPKIVGERAKNALKDARPGVTMY